MKVLFALGNVRGMLDGTAVSLPEPPCRWPEADLARAPTLPCAASSSLP